MTIRITQLHTTDRADWEALYRGYATFYETSVTPKGLDAIWAWIFDDAERFYAIGAVATRTMWVTYQMEVR